jgi:polyvinyl alcohol dehydrogenase (cytochrome)
VYISCLFYSIAMYGYQDQDHARREAIERMTLEKTEQELRRRGQEEKYRKSQYGDEDDSLKYHTIPIGSQYSYQPLHIGADVQGGPSGGTSSAASDTTVLVVVIVLLAVVGCVAVVAAVLAGTSKNNTDEIIDMLENCQGKTCKYDDPTVDWSFTRKGMDCDGHSHKHCSPINQDTVRDMELRCTLDVDGEVSGKTSESHDGISYYTTWNGTVGAFWISTCTTLWSRKMENITGIPGDKSRTTPNIVDDEVGLSIVIGGGIGPHAGANVVRLDRYTGALIWLTNVDNFFDAIITKPLHYQHGLLMGGVSSNEEGDAAFIPNYTCCHFRGSSFVLRATTGEIVSQTYMIAPNITSGAAVVGASMVTNFTLGQYYYWTTTGNLYDDRDANATCIANPPGGDPNNCLHNTTLSNAIVKVDALTGDVKCSFRAGFPDIWTMACIVPFINPQNCIAQPGPDADLLQGVQAIKFRDSNTGELINAIGAGSKGGIYWIVREDDCSFLKAIQVAPGGVKGGLQWGSAADDKRIYAAISNWGHKNFTLINGSIACGGAWASLDQENGNLLQLTVDPSSPLDGACYTLQQGIIAGNQSTDFNHLGYLSHALGPVSVINNVLFGGSTTGMMYAFAATTTMEILWQFNTTGSVNSAPSSWDRYIIFGSGYSHFGVGVGGSHKIFVFGV